MIKLSVTLAVYNEEKFLARCLTSIKPIADEIIIVDGQSTDRTVEIAKKFNAKIISKKNQENFHINKKAANDAATGTWILQMDADEVVSKELAQEIKKVIAEAPKENGFWIPRANFFLGKFLKKGGVYPDYTMRLYRRGKGNLKAQNVHEQASVEGPVGYLKNDLLHFNNPTFGDYIEKRFNRYTDIMAHEVRDSFLENMLVRPLFDSRQGFLPIYFRHLGFKDGFPGFVWALFSALHFPIAYFKLQDLKRTRATESTSKKVLQ